MLLASRASVAREPCKCLSRAVQVSLKGCPWRVSGGGRMAKRYLDAWHVKQKDFFVDLPSERRDWHATEDSWNRAAHVEVQG